MREMKLRYILELVSDISKTAKSDAQALSAAQKQIQQSLQGTDTRIGLVTRALMRMNGVSGSGIERQSQYLSKLAHNALLAQQRIEAVGRGIVTAGKVTMALGAGTLAAGAVLKGPAQQSMSYDRRLAGMVNTAYADKGVVERLAGMKALEASINAARQAGGGTREAAAEALDAIIASGAVPINEAMRMLPGIMKGATASGASPLELATIAIRAKQSYNIDPEKLPEMLSAAMAAGQAGGFELKDMAKWLPQQMAMAKNIGIADREGFAKLAAWNQASVITAGTKDEAGNNLKDLLMEVNTGHFTGFLAKELLNGGKTLSKGERDPKMKQVNDIFLDYQSRGVDKVTATIDLMEKIFAKNEKYTKLKAKLDATDPANKDERRAIMESMAAQMQGTAVGKVFHNQQSLMAFLALMNNRAYTEEVLQKVRAEYDKPGAGSDRKFEAMRQSAIDSAYSVVESTADFKTEQAREANKQAEKAAMDNLTPTIGKVADLFSGLVDGNEGLVGSTILATKALAAFAFTAGAAAVMTGGAGVLGKLGGSIAGKLGLGHAAVTTGAGGAALGFGARAMRLTKGAGALALLGSLAEAGMVIAGDSQEKGRNLTRVGVTTAGGIAAGAAAGAIGGSVIPGIGTLAGLLVGGLIGHLSSGAAFDAIWKPSKAPGVDAGRHPLSVHPDVPQRSLAQMPPVQPPRAFVKPDYLQLTAPKQASQEVGFGKGGEIKVGQGKLDVRVHVTHEQTQVQTVVTQQPALVQVAAGATNPGSYGGR